MDLSLNHSAQSKQQVAGNINNNQIGQSGFSKNTGQGNPVRNHSATAMGSFQSAMTPNPLNVNQYRPRQINQFSPQFLQFPYLANPPGQYMSSHPFLMPTPSFPLYNHMMHSRPMPFTPMMGYPTHPFMTFGLPRPTIPFPQIKSPAMDSTLGYYNIRPQNGQGWQDFQRNANVYQGSASMANPVPQTISSFQEDQPIGSTGKFSDRLIKQNVKKLTNPSMHYLDVQNGGDSLDTTVNASICQKSETLTSTSKDKPMESHERPDQHEWCLSPQRESSKIPADNFKSSTEENELKYKANLNNEFSLFSEIETLENHGPTTVPEPHPSSPLFETNESELLDIFNIETVSALKTETLCKSPLLSYCQTSGGSPKITPPFGITSSHLTRQKLIHREAKQFNCDLCNKVYSRSDELARHKRSHTEATPFKLCDKEFNEDIYIFKITDPLSEENPLSEEKPFQCDVCKKICANSYSLTRHKWTHTEAFQCDVCKKRFANCFNLTRHKRSHTGAKPFKCEWCGKRFANSSHLILHIRSHSGEKPFQCDLCGMEFSDSSNFNRHKISHDPVNIRPFKCNLCAKRFITSSDLTTHKRIHTGEKPFKCNVCGKGFAQSGNLTTHKLSHSGVNPHVCCMCLRGFSTSGKLTTHLKVCKFKKQ